MTADETMVIGCIRFILSRRPNHLPLDDEQYLMITVDELDLDSVDRLDLVMELEQRFDVVFTTNAVTQCRTIGEILAVIGEERVRAAKLGVV